MELIIALIGLGFVVEAPRLRLLRPVAKAVVKAGIVATDATTTVAAVATEQVSDLVAHIKINRTNEFTADGIPTWLDITDLLLIDGVGLKVSGHLNNAGVSSLTQLATTPVERLQEILDAAGPNFGAIDSTTWPEQAQALLAGSRV